MYFSKEKPVPNCLKGMSFQSQVIFMFLLAASVSPNRLNNAHPCWREPERGECLGEFQGYVFS
jgi:hypothetical protein